jgi:hypothetical protein
VAGEFKVEFAEEEHIVVPVMAPATATATSLVSGSSVGVERESNEPDAKRPRALPSFLQGSRIRDDLVTEALREEGGAVSGVSVGVAGMGHMGSTSTSSSGELCTTSATVLLA